MSSFRHPILMLGIGAVVGFYAHKYRKEIIAAAEKYADMGKDFLLEQKENLEDLAAEAREGEEAGEEAAARAGSTTD